MLENGKTERGMLDLVGEQMCKAAEFRRDLRGDDLVRMRIPKRHWTVKFDSIPDVETDGGVSSRQVVKRYIENLSEMYSGGRGLLLFGKNGTGKTSMAVLIGKEYRRRGYTVLFMEAADLKRLVIDKEHFDEDETVWERAMSVDVLIIDDFGKGIADRTGFGARLWDELIRGRNSRKLVTFITTNAHPDDMCEELDLLVSTMASLQEHTVPVEVEGPDQRAESGSWAAEVLLQN